MNSEYLTTKEVADMFRVKSDTVAKWCAKGKYPKKYLRRTSGDTTGSRWLIHKDALKPKSPYKSINSSETLQQAMEQASALFG